MSRFTYDQREERRIARRWGRAVPIAIETALEHEAEAAQWERLAVGAFRNDPELIADATERAARWRALAETATERAVKNAVEAARAARRSGGGAEATR